MEVAEYIREKGAVELLCELEPDGVRYSDLEENMPVAPNTVLKRASQGRKAGLVQVIGQARRRGGMHKYALTPKGARLVERLEDTGARERYHRYREIQKEFEAQAEDFRDWVANNSQKLDDDDRNQQAFEQLETDSDSSG